MINERETSESDPPDASSHACFEIRVAVFCVVGELELILVFEVNATASNNALLSTIATTARLRLLAALFFAKETFTIASFPLQRVRVFFEFSGGGSRAVAVSFIVLTNPFDLSISCFGRLACVG